MNVQISGTTAQSIATPSALNTSDILPTNDVSAFNIYHMQNLLGYGDLSSATTQLMIGAIIIGLLLFIAIVVQFIRQIAYCLRSTPSKYLTRTLVLCGVYTIVGGVALLSLIAYRAIVFCDSLCHFAFLLCAYQYFNLCLDYADGETAFIKRVSGQTAFNVRTPPFCCCLGCLSPTTITKSKFTVLRIMILQMSIVQGVLLAALNVFHDMDERFYYQLLPYFVPFIVTSILTGIWGLQITSRMIARFLPDHAIMPKYFAIQLVLVCYKFQPILIRLGLSGLEMVFGLQLIQSKIIENASIQLLVLLETVCLQFFANRFYMTPVKAIEPNQNL